MPPSPMITTLAFSGNADISRYSSFLVAGRRGRRTTLTSATLTLFSMPARAGHRRLGGLGRKRVVAVLCDEETDHAIDLRSRLDQADPASEPRPGPAPPTTFDRALPGARDRQPWSNAYAVAGESL